MRRPRFLASIVTAGLSAVVASCGSGDRATKSTADASPPGKEAPPLVADGSWVKGGPLLLEDFRGKKVVLLEMGFSSCNRCRATIPHLIGWSQRYADKGLQVIFVNDGTVSPPLASVQQFVKDLKIEFPVLHDERGTTAKAYGVSAYPHVFLIDRKGQIVWDGSPLGREPVVKAAIESVL